MKICFFLQRRFAYIGHAMACQIKEISPESEFCALVQSRTSLEFIKNQKDIEYTSIISGEDIYRSLYDVELDQEFLNKFEKEYGLPNLWPYLYIDRVTMHGQFIREYPYDHPTLSHEDMQRCIQVNAKAIIAFLEKEKPHAIVVSVIGTVASALLYHIARKMGIQTINIEFARIGPRIIFSEDDNTFTWVKERFAEIRAGSSSSENGAAKKFIEDFRGHPVPYDAEFMQEAYGPKGRISELRFLSPKKLMKSVPWHLKTLLADIHKKKNRDYIDNFIWWALWDKLLRKMRSIRGFGDLYSKPDMQTKFAYYPLHTDPEVATMRYAPYHTNQQEIIRAIAHALPINMKLYIKEHPSMFGYRPRRYYEEILKIPNVCLISPNVPSGELSRNAAITLTITSTAGWESLLQKKPVVTFGNTFYNDIPGVKFCRSFDELPYIIKEQLEKWKSDDALLIDYASALLEDSVDVDFSQMWNEATPFEVVVKDGGMRDLSRVLLEKVRSRKK